MADEVRGVVQHRPLDFTLYQQHKAVNPRPYKPTSYWKFSVSQWILESPNKRQATWRSWTHWTNKKRATFTVLDSWSAEVPAEAYLGQVDGDLICPQLMNYSHVRLYLVVCLLACLHNFHTDPTRGLCEVLTSYALNRAISGQPRVYIF